MRYYLSDTGDAMVRSGDDNGAFPVPPGYREVTAEEYQAAVGTVVLTVPTPTAGDPPQSA